MTRLSSDQLLNDNNTRDSASIQSLTLSHRALSDVSCLCDFKSLSRLDLRLNNLASLEGLKSCTNLKWLSVAENKLETLKGIESLSKLAVLNAGKNKLKSMDEVRSVTSLCALILNDNEITSICMLDHMKDLNTLVLSNNPIRDIGQSLVKVKSITKLSLSHCQLQNINTSLKSCTELKELRLAHNNIRNLPAELSRNKKLLNLDLGYNVITRWSDLKVLNSLVILRNLNLQGNPIAADEKLVKKIKKILPKLHVFNAKPIDKYTKNEMGDKTGKNSSVTAEENLEAQAEKVGDHVRATHFKDPAMNQVQDGNFGMTSDFDKKSRKKNRETNENASQKTVSHDDETRNQLKKRSSKNHVSGESMSGNLENVVSEKQSKPNSKENDDKVQKRKGPLQDEDANTKHKPSKKSKAKRGELDVIDDGEVSFVELFNVDNAERSKYDEEKFNNSAGQETKSTSGVVTFITKKKKSKTHSKGSTLAVQPAVEVGMGGASTWGDE